jgi:hypothetical protein
MLPRSIWEKLFFAFISLYCENVRRYQYHEFPYVAQVRLSHFLSEKLVAVFRKFIRNVGKTQCYDREILVGG